MFQLCKYDLYIFTLISISALYLKNITFTTDTTPMIQRSDRVTYKDASHLKTAKLHTKIIRPLTSICSPVYSCSPTQSIVLCSVILIFSIMEELPTQNYRTEVGHYL